jgi:hypothetical protein
MKILCGRAWFQALPICAKSPKKSKKRYKIFSLEVFFVDLNDRRAHR